MAWSGLPLSSITSGTAPRESHSLPTLPSMDMKMYEMMEHLRTVQIVQQEQSRRLDDQAYRLSQLEREGAARENVGQRWESQRYLWGPGPIGGSLGGTPTFGMATGIGGSRGVTGLPGLGFEVFAPSPAKDGKGKELEVGIDELQDFHEQGHINGNVNGAEENAIETDIDNLLHSPTLTAKDTTEDSLPDPSPIDPPSRATSQSPAIPSFAPLPNSNNPITPANGVNYFPYILAIQCYIGKTPDRPPPPISENEIITAQINTSVHASFIDAALIHHLGIAHKIRNRRPARYQARFSNARPRILLPLYFPIDAHPLSPTTTSQTNMGDAADVAKVMIDFVVVNLNDMSPVDHRLFTQIEIGSQALFLHGIDVLFSTRTIRVAGLSIPLPQIAPRDQKRLLSSIALGTYTPTATIGHVGGGGHGSPVNTQRDWDRSLRRGNKDHNPLPAENAWGDDLTTTSTSTATTVVGGGSGPTVLLRDMSTNSSFSSMSTYQPGSTTAVTSPSITEIDPHCRDSNVFDCAKETDGLGEEGVSPQTTSFSSALQFIPSSVVAKPSSGGSAGLNKGDESRSRRGTLALELGSSSAKTVGLDRSQSQGSWRNTGVQEDGCSRRSTQESLPHLSPKTQHHLQNQNTTDQSHTPKEIRDLDVLSPTIPSRNSSLTSSADVVPPHRSSSLVPGPSEHTPLPPLDIDSEIPRLPSTLLDKVVSRKPSSTWPRSLGKKVAPWTSQDATKTSILGNALENDKEAREPQRKMKVLKPVRSGNVHVTSGTGSVGGSGVNGAGGNGSGSFSGIGGSGNGITGGVNGPEMLKIDMMKDGIGKGEVKEATSPVEEKTSARAHVGGGAFHWMK